MKFLKENSSRLKLVVLFLWLSIGAEILNLVSSYLQFEVIHNYINDLNVEIPDFEFVDNLDSFVTVIYLIILILSGIFFI